MTSEPLGGEPDDRFERLGLGKEVAGAWDDFQRLRTGQPRKCSLVELDDDRIVAPDDQERWGANLIEHVAREIPADMLAENVEPRRWWKSA